MVGLFAASAGSLAWKIVRRTSRVSMAPDSWAEGGRQWLAAGIPAVDPDLVPPPSFDSGGGRTAPELTARVAAAVEARPAFWGSPPDGSPALPRWFSEGAEAQRGHFEKLWVNAEGCGLQWSETWRTSATLNLHINIREMRAAMATVKRLAIRYPGCRILLLVDSRVTLGAASKGRSAAAALNRHLQEVLP